MQQKNIITPKTARYFVLGETNERIETIWFVCHGYAQLASYFIKNFEAIKTDKTLIVAPEGLHRFYWQGFSGKIVASWMTKEDRNEDIKDYINYLDAVFTEVLAPFRKRNQKVNINILGFSQGAGTVCRWIESKKYPIANLILWAGVFPVDINFEMSKQYFNSFQTFLVIGDNDQFISEQEVQTRETVMRNNGIKYQLIRFQGKHEINQGTLLQLQEKLQNS